MLSPELLHSLRNAAHAAAMHAYAPYSQFRVGAAVICGGEVFAGCNVENASYGLAMCAERVALFAALAAGRRHLDAIYVACLDATAATGPSGRMPCGACRQVFAEFCDPETPWHVEGVGDFTTAELLPLAFQLPDRLV